MLAYIAPADGAEMAHDPRLVKEDADIEALRVKILNWIKRLEQARPDPHNAPYFFKTRVNVDRVPLETSNDP